MHVHVKILVKEDILSKVTVIYYEAIGHDIKLLASKEP